MPNEKDGSVQEGSLIIDASALAKILVDLPPGETQGMSREQDGFAAVLHEITTNQKEGWGAKAGISDADVSEVVTLTGHIDAIRARLPAARKLVEMLEESEALYDDQRHTLIRVMASSVDSRSQMAGSAIVAKYEATRTYRSAHAHKAVKTRQKRAAEAKAAEKKAEGEKVPG
jgi:hypothetical protein